MTTDTIHPVTDLAQWLRLLDGLPVECDGLSRVTSLLLHRENVKHTVLFGSLTVDGVGDITPHVWIELDDGRILDLRARMWLRQHPAAPHGLFLPDSAHHYNASGVLNTLAEHPIIFFVLAGQPIENFPIGLAQAIEDDASTPRPRIGPR